MPCQEYEEENDAPQLPCFTTPTKAINNDGACHADLDAEGTEYESGSDDEKELEKQTGKKRNYTGHQKYCLVKEGGHWRRCSIGGVRNST